MSRFMTRTLTVLFILSLSTVAFGQATRTWVSGVGDDVNPCSRTAPCKTFAGAISKTATNGEINALDSGGFGAVTITKSITIDGAAAHASILAANFSGVIISSGAPAGVVVSLRNLSINGASTTGGSGIRMLQSGTLNVENVIVANFIGTLSPQGRGISIETPAGATKVSIKDTISRNNTRGLHVAPTGGGSVNVSVEGSSFVHNSLEGARLTGPVSANFARSIISQNSQEGLLAETGADVALFACQVHRNNTGVLSSGAATVVRLGMSSITQNSTNGLLPAGGGAILSHNNNMIIGNGGLQAPTGSSNQQ